MRHTSKVRSRLRVEFLEARTQPGSLLKDSMGWSVWGDLLSSQRQTANVRALIEAQSQDDTAFQHARSLALLNPGALVAPAPARSESGSVSVGTRIDQGAVLQRLVNRNDAQANPILAGLQVQSVPQERITETGAVQDVLTPNLSLQPVVTSTRLGGDGGTIMEATLAASTYLGGAGKDGAADVVELGGTVYGGGHLTGEDGITRGAVAFGPADLTAATVITLGFVDATATRVEALDVTSDGASAIVTGTTDAANPGVQTSAFVARIELTDPPSVTWAVAYGSAADGPDVDGGCNGEAGVMNKNACGLGLVLDGADSVVSLTGSLVRAGDNPGRAMLVAKLDAFTGDQNAGFTYRFRRATSPDPGDSEGRDVAVNDNGEFYNTGYFFDLTAPGDDNQLITGKFDAGLAFTSGLLFINPGDDRGNGIQLNALSEPYVAGYFTDETDPSFQNLAYAQFNADMTAGTGFEYLSDDGSLIGWDIALTVDGAVIVGDFLDLGTLDRDAIVFLMGQPGDDVRDEAVLSNESAPALGTDTARGVAIDESGAVLVVGITNSSDFPTTEGVIQPVHGGDDDAFGARIVFN